MVLVTFTGLYISVPSWFEYSSSKDVNTMSSQKRPPKMSDQEIKFAFNQISNIINIDDGISIHYHPKVKNIFLKTNDSNLIYSKELEQFIPRKMNTNLSKDKISVRSIMKDLHTGHYFGPLGKFFSFVSGILTIFFFITGIYLWGKKSKFRIL